MKKKILILFAGTLFFLVLAKSFVFACNVPVFRYALERWSADPYRLIVFYENNFSEDEQTLIEELEQSAADSTLNISVTLLNIHDVPENARPMNATQYPWMELHYPVSANIRGHVWANTLTRENTALISDSKMLTELSTRLINGDAAVWILLECSDEHKNADAKSLLEKTLKNMTKELKVPTIGYDINGNEIKVDDFKDYDVTFSMLSLSKKNTNESVLVQILLGSEEDLTYFDEPMAFPVFGRGRALYGLIGKGLSQKNIEYACQSIVGWCSCEIKDDNPGIDLLINRDWSNPVGGTLVKNEPLPPLTGISAFIEDTDTTPKAEKSLKQIDTESELMVKDSINSDTIQTKSRHDSLDITISPVTVVEKKNSNLLLRNILFLFGTGLAVLLLVTWLVQRKK